ncbi:copper amine oxidase N-terminal domain-containing protein [Paenibacillus dokdonensis]|uniref:Copper amine oxidase N-terminal domain-containing protein n=1 Tax=Paenibacillus dokdonensis TaxID=2567944 RepID=A0ABU6GWQ4_9BACL|nr:copper amine oxidase N-terminal domain-containing protein [Paenibacillus dokdonensis]MEC0244142.1 copper amine oxidase N-terminal domain-containing protein [Paenibacillus dokdonensis]
MKWDGALQQVKITREDSSGYKEIILTIGDTVASVNTKKVVLSVAPFISAEGSTYVPLRFASEALGAKVGWESDNWTAVIDQ